jgi:hypothetical protein
MAGFYRRDFAPTAAQVIHSACVRSFDEGQVGKAIQKTSAAARLTNVPPASTRRESKALDHATVVSTPELAPVSKATSP